MGKDIFDDRVKISVISLLCEILCAQELDSPYVVKGRCYDYVFVLYLTYNEVQPYHHLVIVVDWPIRRILTSSTRYLGSC